MRVLKTAASEGDVNALVALQYSYAGSRLLWQLDDNTIIMDELVIAQAELDGLAAQYQLTLNANDYDEGILALFWGLLLTINIDVFVTKDAHQFIKEFKWN